MLMSVISEKEPYSGTKASSLGALMAGDGVSEAVKWAFFC